MDASDLLRTLGVDPASLDPAPPWTPQAGLDRLDVKPCVACDAPAVATRTAHIPGYGRRWIDRCRQHLLATASYGSRPVPVDGVLADLADAAHEAGAQLAVLTDP